MNLRQQLYVAKNNNNRRRRSGDQRMLLEQQAAQFKGFMNQQLATFEENIRRQAAAHAEAMEKQRTLHATSVAESHQSAQKFIAEELAKRDEIYRAAREEDLQRLEQRLETERATLQAQKESELAAMNQRYRKLQASTTHASLLLCSNVGCCRVRLRGHLLRNRINHQGTTLRNHNSRMCQPQQRSQQRSQSLLSPRMIQQSFL